MTRESFPLDRPQDGKDIADRILKQTDQKVQDKDYKVQELERTNAELKKTLFDIKDSKNESDKVKSLMGQITELTKEVVALREQNERLKSLANDDLMIVEKVETKEVFGKKSKVMAEIEAGKRAQEDVQALRRQLELTEHRYATLYGEHETLKKRPMVITNYEVHQKEILQKETIIESRENEVRAEREKSATYLRTIDQLKRQLEENQRPQVRLVADPEKYKEILNLRQVLKDRETVITSKINDLQKTEGLIGQLRKQLEEAQKTQVRLVADPEKDREINSLRQTVRDKDSIITNKLNELQAASGLIEQLRRQVGDLHRQPPRVIADPEKDKELNSLRQLLRDKDSLLNAKIVELRTSEGTIDQMCKRVDDLQSNYAKLEVDNERDNQLFSLKQSINEKDSIVGGKINELRLANAAIDQLKKQVEDLHKNQVRLVADPEKDKELFTLRQALKDKDALLGVRQEELRRAEDRTRSLQTTLDSLSAEFSKLRQEKPLEVAHLHKELESKNVMMASIQSQNLASTQQYEQQVRDLQHQLDNERVRIRSMVDQHAREVAELNGSRKQLESTVSQLNDLLDQYRLKMTSQMNDMDSLKRRMEGSYETDNRNTELSLLLKTKEGLLEQKIDENEVLARNMNFYKGSLEKKEDSIRKLELELARIRSLLKANGGKVDIGGLARRIADFIPSKREFMIQTDSSEGVQIDFKAPTMRDHGVNVNFKDTFRFTIVSRMGFKNPKEAALEAEIASLQAKVQQTDDELHQMKHLQENETREFRDKAYTFAQQSSGKDEDLGKVKLQYEELLKIVEKANQDLLDIAYNSPLEPAALSNLLKTHKNQGLELIRGVIDRLREDANKKQSVPAPGVKIEIDKKSKPTSQARLTDFDDDDSKSKYYECYDMNQQLSEKIIRQYDVIGELEKEIQVLKQHNDNNLKVIKKYTEKVEKFEKLEALRPPSFNIDHISMRSTGHDVNYREEIERLKKEGLDWKEKHDKLTKDIINKKRGLLKELENFVNSKNTFENDFLTELNKA